MTLAEDFYTVGEVADLFKIGKTHTYALVKRGDIKAVSIGGRVIRIPRAAIVDYIAKLSAEGKNE
jgi:excisionase family DNA binding protein